MVQVVTQLNWKLIGLAAVLLPVLVSLGFWQLERADQKREILSKLEQQQSQPPVLLADLNTPSRYHPVTLQGHFDNNHYFLLDNRVHKGRPGYEVLVPFRDQSGATVLVNRGWVEAPLYRDQLPAVEAIDVRLTMNGTIYSPLEQPKTFPVSAAGWPKVIQTVEMDQLAQQLGKPLESYTVRLAEYQPGSLVIDWPAVNVQPEKHTAYAVQWFAMALALLVLTFLSQIRRSTKNNKTENHAGSVNEQ
ncbi:SURF1 family protein [Porticoccaceae bacterium LTM1]|nr:SURF1 family protein [Porticoccaceae bacterium LTM1]